MKEFRRNKETGILEVWGNGKKIGEISTFGDEVMNNSSSRIYKQNRNGNNRAEKSIKKS